MPTPDEDTTVPPTPPLDPVSSRGSFTSCPPEEEREARAPREPRTDSPRVYRQPAEALIEIGHATRQVATPEPDESTLLDDSVQRGGEGEKAEHVEDARARDSPLSQLSSAPEDSTDGEVGLGRSSAIVTSAAKERGSQNIDVETPLYLSYPQMDRGRPHPHSTTSFLRPGSKFKGTQTSDKQVYEVQVELKHVDLASSFLCGYLRIQGLTDDHPTLTTFFESEIVGPHHLFRTTNPLYHTTEKIDLQHWARFPAFRPLAKAAKSSSHFTLRNHLDREHLFMRWKEYFLVPDHRVKSISGASFEGFYYICFDQRGGGVSGIYFHAKSEKYQQLELSFVGDGGCVGAAEFR